MSEKLNLALPGKWNKKLEKPSKLVPALLFFLLTVSIANLVVVLYGSDGINTSTLSNALSPESKKELALKLEKQGLRKQAAILWQEYLAGAPIGSRERAKIWYRIGKLFQDTNTYEQALLSYYRSESYAKISELEHELNRRIQECLEASGKFAALRYELDDRVGMSENDSGEEVLAEIGTRKITRVEMDRHIEEKIEHQIAAYAAFMSEEQRNKQKETLLKRFSSHQERARLLNQLILEEILYRKAREDKLADVPAVRALLKDTERSVLARQVLTKELADQIKITPSDIQTYYQAHKTKYIEPEQAKISHILLKDEEAAKAVLSGLGKNADFKALAKKYSMDDATKDKGGKIDQWISPDGYIPGIGHSKETASIVFSAEAGKVAEETIKSDKGIHIIKVRERKPERQKEFDEVQSEVYRDLRQLKEAEVQKRLLAQLKEKYNVVVHTSRLQPSPSDHPKADDSKIQIKNKIQWN